MISKKGSSQKVTGKQKDYSCLDTHNVKPQEALDKVQICNNITKEHLAQLRKQARKNVLAYLIFFIVI